MLHSLPITLHLPMILSSASSFSSRHSARKFHKLFYFRVADTEQVPILKIIYSKLCSSLFFFLIGQSPWGFSQSSPRLLGERAETEMHGECRWLVSWPSSHTGVTWRPDIAQLSSLRWEVRLSWRRTEDCTQSGQKIGNYLQSQF